MDVAIVGAGPAGAWAAYTLARGGARVTIFDPSHPREKPCGGGVTGRALALVGDALRTSPCPVAPIRTARFVDTRRGQSASVALRSADDERPLVVASRRLFDRALLDAAIGAGATLVEARVRDLAVARDGVRLDTTRGRHRADVLVGADGANSLVRRRVAQPFPRDQLSIATGYFAPGCTSDEIVLEMVDDPPGYIWSFPRPDHLAIGICAAASAGRTAASLRETTARWIRETRIAGDAPPLTAYSWPIPSLSPSALGSLTLAGERWCLVGDAAGLVDPLTREGIYFALLSGEWAAASLIDGPFPRRYVERVSDDIAPELMRAARVQHAFFHPALAQMLIEALVHSAAIRRVMADLIAGRQPYKTLKWRLFKTFEFGLAARALTAARYRA